MIFGFLQFENQFPLKKDSGLFNAGRIHFRNWILDGPFLCLLVQMKNDIIGESSH